MSTEDSSQFPPSGYQRTTGGALRWQPPGVEHLQKLLPQYEIITLLGHGGMGAVYKARQVTLDRLVAIKILPPEAADNDAQFIERFKNEARTMAKLDHPAIVHVFDYGETAEQQLYFVMQFVDGTDVSQMISGQGALPPDHALAISAHVCDALQYAHSHGVIHRDIKPANVLLNMEGQVKVADFGLAKTSEISGASGLTKSNMSMGTPDYVAPEALVMGVVTDHRADLYAVGVMLYQMLTGEVPRGMFDMPSRRKAHLDERFDAIIAKAMKQNPDDRYQSAWEIRHDLDQILTTPIVRQGQPVSAAIPKQALAQKPLMKGPGTAHRAQAASVELQAAAPEKKSKLLIPAVLAIVAALGIGAFSFFKSKAPEPIHDQGLAASSAGKGRDEEARTSAPVTPPAVSPAAKPSAGESVSAQADPKKADKAPVQVETPKTEAASSVNAAPATATSLTTPGDAKAAMAGKDAVAPSAPPAPAAAAPSADVPAAAAPGLPPELAKLDEQLKSLTAERVTAIFDGDLSKLNTGYLGALDRSIADEKKAGHLDGVLALEGEKKLVGRKQAVPSVEDESTSTVQPPDVLKKIRVTYRDAFAKLEQQRASNLKLLIDPLTVRLQALESDFTKKDRIADAKIVKEYREGLVEGSAGTPARNQAAAGAAAMTNEADKSVRAPLTTGKGAFTNSLGMKFVPVANTKVLFCIHPTRTKDYATYAAEVPGVSGDWKHSEIGKGIPPDELPEHPVVGVTWDDARAFCAWLGKKEGKTYRLPTDREWSIAVGIGPNEKVTKDSTPESLHGKVANIFPWGSQWPPPKGAGNFGDTTILETYPDAKNVIPGYTDGYLHTSPVMKFKPNRLGLYDMGGNVFQWCEEWYDETKTARVLRGSAYDRSAREQLLSSVRYHLKTPSGFTAGFRCVVEVTAP